MQQLLPGAAPGLAVDHVEAASAARVDNKTVLEAESLAHLQERLVALQQALDCERRQHVLTSAREEQVAGELLAAHERLHNTTVALAASQQELCSTLAEADLLHGQMQASNQAAASLEATAACLTQQLQSANRWLQHQRQATASAQAAAAASAFGCARLEAELRSLRAKLDDRQQQPQPQPQQQQQQQGQSVSSIVAKLQGQNGRLLAERYTALRRCEVQHKQHEATKGCLAAAQQELVQVACSMMLQQHLRRAWPGSCSRSALPGRQQSARSRAWHRKQQQQQQQCQMSATSVTVAVQLLGPVRQTASRACHMLLHGATTEQESCQRRPGFKQAAPLRLRHQALQQEGKQQQQH